MCGVCMLVGVAGVCSVNVYVYVCVCVRLYVHARASVCHMWCVSVCGHAIELAKVPVSVCGHAIELAKVPV